MKARKGAAATTMDILRVPSFNETGPMKARKEKNASPDVRPVFSFNETGPMKARKATPLSLCARSRAWLQ